MTAASKDSSAPTRVALDDGRIPGSLQFLRIRDVCQMLCISKPTLWRLRRSPDFPLPTQLSDRAIGWSRDDIQTWVAARRHSISQPTLARAPAAPSKELDQSTPRRSSRA